MNIYKKAGDWMNATYDELLKLAIAGDAKAFQKLFLEFQEQLKSYLYNVAVTEVKFLIFFLLI